MSIPPNTTGHQPAAALRSHLNWLLTLLTAGLLCVGVLTFAAGLYFIVR